MKNKHLILFSTILITLFSLISCQKETTTDPNQPLIDQMKRVTDSIIQNTNVPGVVALVVDHKRGIDWLYTAGVSDLESNAPMDGSYTFRIGSNSKTFTGTVLLQLVDEGKLKLEDKLSKFFPNYPKSNSITIAMLCNMTSGIYNFTDDDEWWNTLFANPSRVWKPEEIVDWGFSKDFYFTPGTQWHYSNINTEILGLIIEKITGTSLESEISSRIIQPLNLQKTAFLTSGVTFPGPHAKGYYINEYVPGDEYSEYCDISCIWAAGSVYSTPRELQKYVEVLVGGGFLSDSLQKRRLDVIHVLGPVLGYGLCIYKRGSFYGHNGSVMCYNSTMCHSNDKDCTVIIYFNCMLEHPTPDMLFLRYMNILYGNDY